MHSKRSCLKAILRGGVAALAVLPMIIVPTLSAAGQGLAQVRTLPLCTVADRYEMMNGYADVLGITKGSELVPDIGGTALTAKLQIVDLAGLANSELAKLQGSRNMAGVRDYIFDVAKPTFLNFHAPWSLSTRLYLDPRLTADYDQIFSTPNPVDDSDWVRKDAVSSPAKLAQLRAYAQRTYVPTWDYGPDYVRGSCGATLRPGQLPPNP